MPRAARVVVEGVPHHITQRGNNRQDVFLVDEDRRYYLEILRDKCRQHGVTLLGYCLMTNHVHLIGVPRQPTSLALAPGPGPLALRGALPSTLPPQRPFVAKPLLFVSVRAPSLGHRAGLCGPESTAGGAGGEPLQYPWSSAAAHVAGRDPIGLVDEWEWTELELQSDWKQRLETKMGEGDEAELRQATYSAIRR